jgi:hypothetical protein
MVIQYNRKPLSNENVIELYSSACQRLRHHHDAIWKEETHYTWLVYILIAGTILALTCNVEKPWNGIIAIILSLTGIFACIIGFNVISRERQFFEQASDSCKRYTNELGITETEGVYEKTSGISIFNWFRTTILIPVIIFVLLIFAGAFGIC